MQTNLVKRFSIFLIAGATLFSGSAIASQIYLSDNTPEKGFSTVGLIVEHSTPKRNKVTGSHSLPPRLTMTGNPDGQG